MRLTLFLILLFAAECHVSANAKSYNDVADSNKIYLTLKTEVRLTRNNIKLSDVVDFDNRNKVIKQKIFSLIVGKLPRNSYGSFITQSRIEGVISRTYPGISGNIVWKGSARVKIHAVRVVLPANEYLNEASDFLVHRLSGKYMMGLSVAIDGDYKELELPAGKVDISPKLLSAELVAKKMCVWVDINVAGEHYQSIPVWFSVNAYSDVYIAKIDLDAKAVFNDSQFMSKQIDVTELSSLPATYDDLQGNWRIKRIIRSGDVLLREQLEPIPAVSIGQMVKVRSLVGNVAIETVAIAMDDGAIGSRINVNKQNTDIVYMTKIISAGVVLVDAN